MNYGKLFVGAALVVVLAAPIAIANDGEHEACDNEVDQSTFGWNGCLADCEVKGSTLAGREACRPVCVVEVVVDGFIGDGCRPVCEDDLQTAAIAPAQECRPDCDAQPAANGYGYHCIPDCEEVAQQGFEPTHYEKDDCADIPFFPTNAATVAAIGIASAGYALMRK